MPTVDAEESAQLLGLAVAACTLKAAWDIMADAVSELLDQELPASQREQIIGFAKGHSQVRGVHDLRPSGIY